MATHDHDRHHRGSPNTTGDFVISGTQLGIGTTDNLSTLTVRSREPFTLSGTVDTTFNSATVTGASTKFLTELNVGDTIEITPDWLGRKGVIAIASDTSLTVDSPFKQGYTGAATARPSAARFDDGSGEPKAVINDQGNIGIGTAGPRGMLEVTGKGAGDLDYCPVGIRVHSPLDSDVWPLIMSTETSDGTTTSSSGFAIWVTQMQNDGGATLTFSLFNNDDITLHDYVKIDGTGLHLASQFSANVGGISSNYTVSPLDHYLYGETGSAGITITLPDSSLSVGRELYIYKLNGTGDVTVAAFSDDRINGVPSKTISTPFNGLHLVCPYVGFWFASVMTAA